jgi:hypothetical protein
MPLKGYHRVGGPNATLTELGFGGHGTPSQQYPAAGTYLRTDDTSRYENDYVGQPHWMPYSTDVYANGLGGEYGVENWQLQYLPAGWVTGIGEIDHYIYVAEAGQNVLVGTDTVYNTEDGTGINSPVTMGPAQRPNQGDLLVGPYGSAYPLTSSYYDNSDNTWHYPETGVYVRDYAYYNSPNDSYYIQNGYDSGSNYPDGTFIVDQPDSYVEVPTGSGNTYFDGNDNRYEWDGSGNAVYRYSGLYSNGTYITNYQDYNYYWDGFGGFYQGEYTGGNGGGGGYPPYGNFIRTEYGVPFGGGESRYSSTLGQNIYNQHCDVNVLADGSGGEFYDWSNATNVGYYEEGTAIGTLPNSSHLFGNLEVPDGSGNYYPNQRSVGYSEEWNGGGEITEVPYGGLADLEWGYVYAAHNVEQQAEVPQGSSNYYGNGLTDYNNYIANGIGGWTEDYVETLGSYHGNGTEVDSNLRSNTANAQTEVPTSSGNYYNNGATQFDTYVWDGNGGYFYTNLSDGSYYASGTFIYNDGMGDYYWDGNGGYYYV